MSRVINFSSGPAALPINVLQRAAADMLDWHGSGMSVMEMSHRGPEFTEILAHTQALIRSLLGVPDNYEILLLQGGAIAENAIVPMNLIGRTGSADYVLSGVWSEKSMKEAAKYGQVNLAASSKDSGFCPCPSRLHGSCRRKRLMCICAAMKPLAVSNAIGPRTPAACRWWLICRPTSCPRRWMSANTA